MLWSAYQESIFQFVASGTGDGIVEAVAGGAKTTVCVESARHVTGSSRFLAFGKDIAETLNKKLVGTSTTASTIHSAAYGTLTKALGKLIVKDTKYRALCREWVNERCLEWQDSEMPKTETIIAGLYDLVNKTRYTLTRPDDRDALWQLVDQFGIDMYAPALPGVLTVIARGKAIAQSRREVDFTDMVYLSVDWGLQPPQFDFLFIDEAQDLSRLLLTFALKMRAPGGRILAVGDSRQAIMGFSGALTDSMEQIRTATSAVTLPLSVCYRCPTSHLDMARQIVPHIEAAPGARSGVVMHVPAASLADVVKANDAVICRTNAPLIELCLRLIVRGIPAKVRGRNVAEQLQNNIRDVTRLRGYTWERFDQFLKDWTTKQLFNLERRDASETAIEALMDRADGIRVCFENFDAKDADDLCKRIDAIFDDRHSIITLSSVHRFKGQEAERVFILEPELLDKTYGTEKPWMREQRENLKYVAFTRSTDTLVLAPVKADKVTLPDSARAMMAMVGV